MKITWGRLVLNVILTKIASRHVNLKPIVSIIADNFDFWFSVACAVKKTATGNTTSCSGSKRSISPNIGNIHSEIHSGRGADIEIGKDLIDNKPTIAT